MTSGSEALLTALLALGAVAFIGTAALVVTTFELTGVEQAAGRE